MKANKIVKDYIKKIKRELFGLDLLTQQAVIEELESHIKEKANDLAKNKGLTQPDDEIFHQVITSFGTPDDVTVEYLRVLPKKLTRGIKLFLILQIFIGVISIIFGLDQLVYSYDIFIQEYISETYFLGMFCAGLVFVFIGIILLVVIINQIKKPERVVQYGAFATIISITLGFGTILIMLDAILWRYTNLDYSMDLYYATVAPALILMVIGHVFGLQAIERLQRRFALEELDKPESGKHAKKSKLVMAGVALVTIILISMIFFSMVGYEWLDDDENRHEDRLFNTEHIGGKYYSDLELWYCYQDGMWWENYKIIYTIDGSKHEGAFNQWYLRAYDWIINNTDENATILSWWDYGHSIRGYTGRGVVVTNPSEDLKPTIYDPSTVKVWETDESKIENVAKSFLTTDPAETVDIMKNYNATYIFTTAGDRTDILYSFFYGVKLDMDKYFERADENYMWNPTELGRQTTIVRMWSGEQIPELQLVYSDLDCRIYTIS